METSNGVNKKILKTLILSLATVFVFTAASVFASEITGTLTTGIGGNVGSNVDGVVISAPSANPTGGYYAETQNVVLTAAGATSIHYTTDGETTPDCASGAIYSTPIAVAEPLVIQALSCYPGDLHSTVASFGYIVGVAPQITKTAVANDGEQTTSITITWTTDHPATSRVIYDTVSHSDPLTGAAPNYGYFWSTDENSNKVTDHSVIVSGLTPGATYYFRTVSHGSPESVSSEITGSTKSIIAALSSIGGGGNGGGGGIMIQNTTSGDINGDNKVDILDFNALMAAWGTYSPMDGLMGTSVADLNKDGKVDILDFNILVANWK